jgi:hypothetical protein
MNKLLLYPAISFMIFSITLLIYYFIKKELKKEIVKRENDFEMQTVRTFDEEAIIKHEKVIRELRISTESQRKKSIFFNKITIISGLLTAIISFIILILDINKIFLISEPVINFLYNIYGFGFLITCYGFLDLKINMEQT